MKKVFSILSVLLIVLSCIVLGSCGKSVEKTIVGRWEDVENENNYVSFSDNGTLRYEGEGYVDYSIDGDTLIISDPEASYDEIYEWSEDAINDYRTWFLKGDTLIFSGTEYRRAD